MGKSLSPFTKEELIPQEERLEVHSKHQKMMIGMPKETVQEERRICLTPDAVTAITAHGHRVKIQRGAGEASGFKDKEYSEAGAELVSDAKSVFECPIILKVAPPTLKELDLIKPQSLLLSVLQLKTTSKAYYEKLSDKRITALAYEYIMDDAQQYPVVKSLSEITGVASVLIAAELLCRPENGTGQLFGNITGVPPIEVVIIGAGRVGEYAARTALGLGAGVKVFDNSLSRLRSLQMQLTHNIYTSTIQPKYLSKALRRCDVAIGALGGQDRAPVVVTSGMVENMKIGSVVMDISIDMGGCFETSEITTHSKPTFDKFGVHHYCVPNIPSRYSKSASISLSNILTTYLLDIAENGGIEHSIRLDKGLKCGVYMYHGILTNKSVGQWFDLPASDVNLLIF